MNWRCILEYVLEYRALFSALTLRKGVPVLNKALRVFAFALGYS